MSEALSPAPRILVTPAASGTVTIKPAAYLGDTFRAYTAAVAGARFDGVRKCYVAPVTKLAPILTRLRDAGFEIDAPAEVRALLVSHVQDVDASVEAAAKRLEVMEARFQARGLVLYPFQRQGVLWLASRYAGLLADCMGLGKTIQMLAALPDNAPVVVVCPAVVKGVWAREAAKWRPDYKVTMLSGRGSFRMPVPGEMIVINYDILASDPCRDMGGAPFEPPRGLVVVADEAHALKTSKSQRTVKFRALSSVARSVGGRLYLLTATPLLNRPQELWSLLEAADLAREAFASWKQFCGTFRGKEGPWGGYVWGVPGEDAAPKLQRVSLRRERETVLPDLPTKTWREVTVEIDAKTRRLCDKVASCILDEKTHKRLSALERKQARLVALDEVVCEDAQGREVLEFTKISAARAALADCKAVALEAMIREYEDQGEPLVVFSAHREAIDALAEREGWAVITGDTKPELRTEIEERFQRGELRGIGATIQAGGVGITLTRASHVVFVDQAWTPALNEQAEDRVCRIGQTRGVVVTLLVCDHPLDERLAQLLGTKNRIIGASVGAAEVVDAPPVARVDVTALLGEEKPEPPPSSKPEVSGAPRTERVSSSGKVFRVARTAEERWAIDALRTLAGLDGDRARDRNDMGFNQADGGMGHSLVKQADRDGMLTDGQWQVAIQIARRYPRQVGRFEDES